MFVKKTSDCDSFTANDGCEIRELLHPKNDAIELPYSLALATVEVGKRSYRHKLEQAEVYHLQQGKGMMHVEDEQQEVSAGDVIHVPANSIQWIENTGQEPLVFTVIVNPPWSEEGDTRLE